MTVAIKKFTVSIQYHTLTNYKTRVYAANSKDAEEIALKIFHETHTEACRAPTILETSEDR
jgi:hypothetical protein